MHDLVATAAGQLLFLIYSADTWCGAGVGTGIDPGAIETVGCNGCSTNINGCSTNISNSSELWRQQAFILSAVGKCQPPKYELRWVTTALCLNLTCPISATSDSSFCLLSEQPLAACASMRDFEKLLRVSPSNELQRVSDGWALDWGRWRAGGPEQLGFEAAAPVVAWKQWYNDSCPSIWTTQDSGGRCCLTVETTPPAAPPPPPRPGHTTNIVTSEYNYTSKYALLDPAIVGHSANGAFLTMGPVKKLGRPLISEGQTPWEQPAVTKITSPTPGFRTLGYGNVYPSVYWNESSRRYTLYINPFISNAPCSSPPGKQHAGPGVMASGVLRFTSADGLAWQRSDEGQVPWNGSTANNIVAYPTGGVGILSDPAALSMQAAVKMWGVYYIDETAAKPVSTTRAGGRWSSDGVRWLAAQAMNDYSQFGASMDTHNNAFYDKRTQRWIGITRTHERVGPGNVNVRCAARTEAMNFSGPWSTAETVLCGNCTTADPRSPYSCQVYAMIVAPYYQVRAMYVHSPSERGIGFSRPHWHCRKSDAYDGGGRTPSCETVQGYIGFTMMFNGGYGATMGQQWNDSQGLVETVELELSWSNDTRTWTRILPGTPLIPRSPWPHPTSVDFPSGPFDSYIIFAPAYPILHQGELHMFYGSSDGPHTSCPGKGWDQGWRAPRAIEPTAAARISTTPRECDGNTLILSMDVHSPAGYVKATLRDANAPLPSTSTNWSMPIHRNITDEPVSWAIPRVVDRLRGKKVVVEFLFSDATIYAFGFSN